MKKVQEVGGLFVVAEARAGGGERTLCGGKG
eukprot:SAG31_NODE_48901_length_163_cov_59.375000_1_plen_30_part_01